jgi:hypothetical protein
MPRPRLLGELVVLVHERLDGFGLARVLEAFQRLRVEDVDDAVVLAVGGDGKSAPTPGRRHAAGQHQHADGVRAVVVEYSAAHVVDAGDLVPLAAEE